MTPRAARTVLGWTLQDAVAAATVAGGVASLNLGGPYQAGAIAASREPLLAPAEAKAALAANPGAACHLSVGNQAAAPALAALIPLLEDLLAATGAGFMALCLAAPALGRTVYQGHMFAGGRLLAALSEEVARQIVGRVITVPLEVVRAGVPAIRRQLSAAREQGVALAVMDCLDDGDCAALEQALGDQLLVAGPAWLVPAAPGPDTVKPPPEGRTAIIAGALDRQTLFQLGAASGRLPFLQLDLAAPDAAGAALGWAAAQTAATYVIAASAPPDRLYPDGANGVLGEIAAGLAASGIPKFVLAGNDTAASILHRLGVTRLRTGAAQGQLRWLQGGDYNFLLKPGGFGGRDLFLDDFGPQIRLNAADNIAS
jgi:uncharacterized protein YgbK (DUF1537 family)